MGWYAVAGGGDLSDKVFNLIDWAERTGRVRELVEKAEEFIANYDDNAEQATEKVLESEAS